MNLMYVSQFSKYLRVFRVKFWCLGQSYCCAKNYAENWLSEKLHIWNEISLPCGLGYQATL